MLGRSRLFKLRQDALMPDETSTPDSSMLLNSLLRQLMGNISNPSRGFNAIGQSAREYNQRSNAMFDPRMKGSVMQGRMDPSEVAGLGGLANPMQSAGGALAGIISPSNWKSMQPEMKALMNVLGDKFPAVMQKVLANPREFMLKHAGDMGMGAPLGTMDIRTPGHALLSMRKDQTKNADVLMHELQHGFSHPRVAATDPADAATIGMLGREILPQQQPGSLVNRMEQYIQSDHPSRINGPLRDLAANDAKIAREAQTYNTQTPPAPFAGGTGYYKPGESSPDFYGRAMMDEFLASLSEHSIPRNSGLQGKTPWPPGQYDLMDLAKKMGVGTGTPSPGNFVPGVGHSAPVPVGTEMNSNYLTSMLNRLGVPESKGPIPGPGLATPIAPTALPPKSLDLLNPHDARLTGPQQVDYNKLAPGSRSSTVPEDIRRLGMGEQINMAGMPREQRPSGAMGYDMWKMLAKQLGIAVE